MVLVEPRIPQNTGNIARLCACTGVELYLVGDLGFRLGDKYLARAGMDYLETVNICHVRDFPELLNRHPGWETCYFSTRAQRSYVEAPYPDEGTLLVFGSEDRGLPGWLIDENPDRSFRIPMREGARSLNLSSAVAIVVYEALRPRRL